MPLANLSEVVPSIKKALPSIETRGLINARHYLGEVSPAGGGISSNQGNSLFDMDDLDLDSDVVDCFNDNFTSEAKLIIQDLLEFGVLKDKCGERSPEEIMADLLNSLCEDFSNNNASGNSTGDDDEDLGNEQVNINQWNIKAVLENDDCISVGNLCRSSIYIQESLDPDSDLKWSLMTGLNIDFRSNNNPAITIPVVFNDVCFSGSTLSELKIQRLLSEVIDAIEGSLANSNVITPAEIQNLFDFHMSYLQLQYGIFVTGGFACQGVQPFVGIWGIGNC